MCHCERSEAISRDCPSTSSGHADHGEPVEPFAPRNDYFSGSFTIICYCLIKVDFPSAKIVLSSLVTRAFALTNLLFTSVISP
jgi:hypothetical protein